jgi:hypothetical protein
MIKSGFTVKFLRNGEPGTLGAVCKAYFNIPSHKGCPFQLICCADNLPIELSIPIRIIRNADAETLEAMAKAIRATEERGGREENEALLSVRTKENST